MASHMAAPRTICGVLIVACAVWYAAPRAGKIAAARAALHQDAATQLVETDANAGDAQPVMNVGDDGVRRSLQGACDVVPLGGKCGSNQDWVLVVDNSRSIYEKCVHTPHTSQRARRRT